LPRDECYNFSLNRLVHKTQTCRPATVEDATDDSASSAVSLEPQSQGQVKILVILYFNLILMYFYTRNLSYAASLVYNCHRPPGRRLLLTYVLLK